MIEFLEITLILFIGFRWVFATVGIVLILILLHLRRQKKDQKPILYWFINFALVIVFMVVFFSVYIILAGDFQVPLPIV